MQQDVLAELRWEPSVNAAPMGVDVTDGIVTLNGQVGSFAEKRDAERAAQRVAGVRGMAIELGASLPASDQRQDADIARAAENLLQWTSYLPRGNENADADRTLGMQSLEVLKIAVEKRIFVVPLSLTCDDTDAFDAAHVVITPDK